MMLMSLRSLIRGPLPWGLVGISWLLILVLAFFLVLLPQLIFVVPGLVYFAIVLTLIVSIVHIIEYLSRPAAEKTQVRKIVQDWRWWIVIFVLWMLALLGVFQVRDGINWGFSIAIMVTLIVLVAKAVERLTRPARTAQQRGV